jgi:hypothetical protein
VAIQTASFEIAAFDAEAKKKGEQKYVELQHGGGRFSLWRPIGQGMFGRFTIDINKAGFAQQLPVIDKLLQKVLLSADEVQELAEAGELDDEGVPYADRLEAGEVAVDATYFWDAFEAGALKDDDGEESVLPILRMVAAVMKATTGFPTESSSASTATPPKTGPRSTATSRRQASNRSTSRRAASQP